MTIRIGNSKFQIVYVHLKRTNLNKTSLTMSNVSELHHVCNLPPSVLADPIVDACITIKLGRNDIVVTIVGRSNPIVCIMSVNIVSIPVVRRHHSGESIGPSQHEGICHLKMEFTITEAVTFLFCYQIHILNFLHKKAQRTRLLYRYLF